MKIVLLGYMGSGKTTVGIELSRVLNFNFLDLDKEIEEVEKMSIRTIFSEKGEIYFRKRENVLLKKMIGLEKNMVLATGGGTPCYGDSLQVLSNNDDVITVYLKVSLREISKRLASEKDSRPLLSHLDEHTITDFVRKHLFERSFYYNQADHIIDVSEETIPEIVEKIVLKLF